MAAEISVVVVLFNEEQALPELLARIGTQDAERVQFVMVDNGSSDGTAALLSASGLDVVSLPENRGFGGGVKAGLRRCSGAAVAWMPGSLRVDPADAVRLAGLAAQYDIPVKGRRYGRGLRDQLFSLFSSTLFSLASSRFVPEVGSTPTVVPARIALLLQQGPAGVEFEAWSWLLLRSTGLPVLRPKLRFHPRPYGTSRWRSSWRSGPRLLWSICSQARQWRRELPS